MRTVIVLELSLLGTAAQLHINNGSKKLDKNSITCKIFMYLFYFILLESVFTTLVGHTSTFDPGELFSPASSQMTIQEIWMEGNIQSSGSQQ